MKTDAVFTRPIPAEKITRQIALRTRGHLHGGVTRLVSPGDIGELIKPFVFLDYFEADPATAPKFGFHRWPASSSQPGCLDIVPVENTRTPLSAAVPQGYSKVHPEQSRFQSKAKRY